MVASAGSASLQIIVGEVLRLESGAETSWPQDAGSIPALAYCTEFNEMHLYLISQDVNDGYDTYDSAVVCADNEEEARRMHPDGRQSWDDRDGWGRSTWASSEDVYVKLLGRPGASIPKGVICASFNAG